jgi:carboxypeptidase family protein
MQLMAFIRELSAGRLAPLLVTIRHLPNAAARSLIGVSLVVSLPVSAQNVDDPSSNVGTLSGTVADVNGGVIPGARVSLECQNDCGGQSALADDSGSFGFRNLATGVPYRVGVSAAGFEEWTSPPIVLTLDRHDAILNEVRVRMVGASASVSVYASREQIAEAQVHFEEQQRVLGIIPNFYVVYDSKNAEPLSAKLKFQLAMRVAMDPVTLAGVGFISGIQQAGNTPNYAEGAKGYGQRFGANAAGGFSDILFGGAVLPSLLHQDPRYFYQGSGTKSSRLRHALLSPFICRGDNGRSQVNLSSLGGDLISSSLAQTYRPDSNRGPGLLFSNFAIGTGERMLSGVIQEFVIRRLTSRAHSRNF